MRRLTLIGSTALGIVLGAVLFNAAPAYADLPTIDVGAIAAIQAVKGVMDTVSSTLSQIQTYANNIFSSLGNNVFGSVQQLLQEGFTQQANYSKAAVGANEQITDASNTAMARFTRNQQNTQIRDEQTVSPAACAAVDGGVATAAAGIQGFGVGAVISHIHDLRGEAGAGMPSHFGQGQAVASMAVEHIDNYCNQDDSDAGMCPNGVSQTPDADQQVLSLFGGGTYASQAAVNAAKDYTTNLIEPVAPAALRGDQLSSTAGQDAIVQRRSFNARMSLAQGVVDNAIGMQTPSVPPTAVQQQYLQNKGLPVPGKVSWLQELQIESERRFEDLGWQAQLQAMPPASVNREIALELALTDFLLFQDYKMNLQHTSIGAVQLAETTQRNFMPTVQIPTPAMAAQ